MKDQYFGDVNDYRKYGLLRQLALTTDLPLGVFWLLTAADGRRDGEARRYLDQPKTWAGYDPVLYERLRTAASLSRSVALAEQWQLLPRATYVRDLVTNDAAARRILFSSALNRFTQDSLLFFDPDNGIEVRSVPFGRFNSCKYVYWDELAAAYERGHSLVVYQHYPRVQRARFHEQLGAAFAARLAAPEIRIFSTSFVAFVVVPHHRHLARFESVGALVESRWGGQIRQAYPIPA